MAVIIWMTVSPKWKGWPDVLPRSLPTMRVPPPTMVKNTAMTQAITASVMNQPEIRSHAGSVKR